MRLSEVRHQERAVGILRRALRSGRTHHAYLFEGPEGVGKELAARALAARLLCVDESLAADADACGACPACRLMASDNHPDFHLIHRGLHKVHPDRAIRASKGLFLAVDLVRHFLIEPAGMKPTQGRRRVFLIRDAERMNEEAQNALLKTLEEPPGSACLILVTASASRLLPTIRSRCQHVPFDPLPPTFVAGELSERLGASEEDALALAGLADGRLGVAMLWWRVGLLEMLATVGDIVDELGTTGPAAFGQRIVEVANELALGAREQDAADAETSEDSAGSRSGGKSVSTDELRTGLKLVLMLVAAVYREALVRATGATALCRLARQAERVKRLAGELSLDRLDTCVRAVSEAEHMLDRNVAPQLACERLAVALLGDLPVVG